MNSQYMPRPWRTWIGWALANTAGCVIGFGLLDFVLRGFGLLTLETPQTVNAVVYTFGAGFLAMCQWLFLGLRVTGWAAWLAATMLGFLVGDLGYRAFESLISSSNDVGELTTLVVFFAAIGVCIGVGQWLLLRRSFPHAGWWIPANAIGWAGGGLSLIVVQLVVQAEPPQMAFYASLGIITGVVTGLCLVWLWRARNDRQATDGVTP